MIYPLDYSYLKDTHSGDGHEIDVWIGSLKGGMVTGIVCTVDAEKRDSEMKILLGWSKAERRRILAFHNRGDQAAIHMERA